MPNSRLEDGAGAYVTKCTIPRAFTVVNPLPINVPLSHVHSNTHSQVHMYMRSQELEGHVGQNMPKCSSPFEDGEADGEGLQHPRGGTLLSRLTNQNTSLFVLRMCDWLRFFQFNQLTVAQRLEKGVLIGSRNFKSTIYGGINTQLGFSTLK